MRITTDMIVGTGLAIALILCIVLGGPSDVATNLSAGLVGYLGRSVIDRAGGRSISIHAPRVGSDRRPLCACHWP